MQTAFLVPVNGKLKCFPFDDVLFITAKDKYSEIVTAGQKKWLTRVPISYIQEKLPEHLFARVHRTCIISLSKVERLEADCVEIEEHKLSISKEGFRAITERMLVICPEMEKKMRREMEKLTTMEYVHKIIAAK